MEEKRNHILSKVIDNRIKLEETVRNLKKINARYTYISIIASALATLLSGLTAALGPLVGQGAPAWKLTCGSVAVLTAFAGLFTGIHQRFSIPEKLAKAYTCLGRLNSFEIALTITQRDPIMVAKEYEEFAVGYQDFLF